LVVAANAGAEVVDKVPSAGVAFGNLVVRLLLSPLFFMLGRTWPTLGKIAGGLGCLELYFAVFDFSSGDIAEAVAEELGIMYLWSWSIAALVLPVSALAGVASRSVFTRKR
jgi:hypothetical protein